MFGFNNGSDENDEPREDAHNRDRDELRWGYVPSIIDGSREVPDGLVGCFSAIELNDGRLVVYDCENPDGWVASTRRVGVVR